MRVAVTKGEVNRLRVVKVANKGPVADKDKADSRVAKARARAVNQVCGQKRRPTERPLIPAR